MQDGESLILNPSLRLSVNFTAPRRGREAVRGRVDVRDNPALSRFLLAAAHAGEWTPELRNQALPLLPDLLELGIVIPTPAAGTRPEFADAFLDAEDLLDSIPSPSISARPPGELRVSGRPSCAFAPRSSGGEEGIWAEPVGPLLPVPVFLSGDRRRSWEDLSAGRILVRDLGVSDRDFFRLAGLLRGADAPFAPALADARAQYAREGYGLVRGLLPPLQLAALRLFFRSLREGGFFELDRVQVPDMRAFLHNEEVSRHLQGLLRPVLDAVTGSELKPSYTFLTSYFPGAELARHTDREQCAWNVSLMIDTGEELSLGESWPLCFEKEGRVSEARLLMGDAVIYSGTDVPHWRPPLRGESETMVLLGHYVSRAFRGGLD